MRRVLVGAGFVVWVMGLSAVLGAKTEIRAATMSSPPPSNSWPAPAPPTPPPSSSFAPTTGPAYAAPATCSGGRTSYALAIPQGKSGVIEIVLTDRPLGCSYWANLHPTGCNSVGARIGLRPAQQKLGTRPVNVDFAHLGHEYTSPGGVWQSQPACNDGGGELKGTLEITRITQHEIHGRICGSHTDDPKQNGLVDGTFVAKRCPACSMTGDSCESDAQCCTNLCGDGTCDP